MGILYIIGTPIGNLEDITLRAIRILKEVDLIACEDTRHSKILLDHYQINTPTISYHQHSKLQKISYLIEQLKLGKNVALISDAGTPGINDPGGMLVSEALKNNIKIIPIPGASAIASALSIWGFAADDFLYLGFLPKKKGRQTLLRNLMKASALKLYQTIVIYESPYQLLRTLTDLQLVIGDKDVLVARELTKLFEENVRGKISEVIQYFQAHKPKGEFVIVIKTN
jgi:16S rRNA (cytidine1402-2'-O)-methyltransferase